MVPRTIFYDLPREPRTKTNAYAIVRPDTKPLRVNPTEGQDATDLAIGLLGTIALIRIRSIWTVRIWIVGVSSSRSEG
jgi:hypothetical protein